MLPLSSRECQKDLWKNTYIEPLWLSGLLLWNKKIDCIFWFERRELQNRIVSISKIVESWFLASHRVSHSETRETKDWIISRKNPVLRHVLGHFQIHLKQRVWEVSKRGRRITVGHYLNFRYVDAITIKREADYVQLLALPHLFFLLWLGHCWTST